jgi:hypothetical protein
MRNYFPVVSILIVCLGLSVSASSASDRLPEKVGSHANRLGASNLDQKYGVVPLAFEPNQGQAASDVRFLSRAQGLTVLLKRNQAALIAASSPTNRSEIRMSFPGADFPNEPYALDEQPGISNYLMGKTPEQWRTNIPNFGRVQYTGIYPGIDLVMYGNHRQLEHDFVVAPGADYHKILVKLDGATRLTIGDGGELQVETASGNFVFHAPIIYQNRGRKKELVEGSYNLVGADEFSFQVGSFDPTLALVIDPVLSYSTYLAGSSTDQASGIKIDVNGYAYVTGYTTSINFPASSPFQGTCSGVCSWPDVFVTKLNTTGTALVYSTFLGGSKEDRATSIAVDSLGNASVSGLTWSLDFPQKNGLSVILNSNSNHGFVFSLNPAGSALNFSTYLAGEGNDYASAVATDPSGNVYVAGTTSSSFFPVTPGHQIGPLPDQNFPGLFVTKFSRTGSLAFSSLIGGSSRNFPGTFVASQTILLAANAAGEAVFSGTAFDGFPTTSGAYQPNDPNPQFTSAFLAKLKSDGTSILSGTYLGSTGGSEAHAIALDASGNVYITGTAYSSDFPTTPGSYQPSASSGQFISKLDPALSTLIYSTYFGPNQFDGGNTLTAGIAVDAQGRAFVTGTTSQFKFPLVSPVIGNLSGPFFNTSAAFLSVLNPSGSSLTFSTYFSGSSSPSGSSSASGTAVALGYAGNPYITGSTSDTDLPTTPGAFQTALPATPFPQPHAFVTKFLMTTANAAACLSEASLSFPTTRPGQSSLPIPVTVTNCGTLPLTVSSATPSTSNFVASLDGCASVAPGATCTINVRFTPAIVDGVDNASLKITSNAPIKSQSISLSGYSAMPNLTVPNELTAPLGVIGVKGYPVTSFLVASTLPVNISKIVLSGNDFTLINQCAAVLQPGEGCLVGVVFTPKAAGLRTGSITVYDDALGNPHVISVKGTAVASYPKPTLTFVSPGSAAVGSGPVSVLIEGTGIYPTSKFALNGAFVAATPTGPDSFNITIPASLLTTMTNILIQVVNPAPGGYSLPYNFVVYKHIALGAADALYEPFTRKFYASLPATDTTSPNTLVTIDPVTFAKGTPIPIGNDPGALGLSTDGTILYVGLNGNNSIVPFNLLTQKAGPEIPLGSDPQRLPLTAADIQVQPDHPANFIAILNSGFYGRDGLDWIKDGKVITQYLNQPPVNEAPGGGLFLSTNHFYTWNNNFNGNGFSHFVVSGNDLLQAPGFFEQLGIGQFDSDGKNFYDINGRAYAVSDGTEVGNFFAPETSVFNSAVMTDTNSARTFFLGNQELRAFDSKTFAEVGRIPGLRTFQSSRFQRWGANGLAYLDNIFTQTNDLYLFRTPLLYPAAGPNPAPVLTSLSPSPVTSKGSNFLLTVTGSNFVRGAVVQWNGVTRTTNWISTTKLVADIQASEIKNPGTAKITVVNPSPGGGVSSSLNLSIK